MKAVLLSIRPKWCSLIASGKKTIEVRKTRPKLDTPFKCYIYCTKPSKRHQAICGCMVLNDDELYRHPRKGLRYGDSIELMLEDDYTEDNFLNGKVIGEFTCDDIGWHGGCDLIVKEDLERATAGSCISRAELIEYLGFKPGTSVYDKKCEFYCWHISDLVIYEKPRKLGDFMRKPCDFAASCGACIHAIREEINGFSGVPVDGEFVVKHPPQSWCYVRRKEDNHNA